MHGDLHDHCVLGTATRGLELAAPITLSQSDRRRHLHVIGKTGTGKSSLLFNLMLADLAADRGFALLDPHGDLAQAVLDAVPPERTNDVRYINPGDLEFPVGFNPLDRVVPDSRPLVAAHLVAAFKHLWLESWGPRLEYILLNSLRLLLDAPGTTLLGLPRLLVDKNYRAHLLRRCGDPMVHAFWTQEFASYHDRFLVEAVAPLQNKVGVLVSPPLLRNIIGQQRSTINIARIMNEGQILIANLSKGQLGEGPSHLIGAFLATAFAQAAEARAKVPEEDRRDFHLYVDEFQNFATDSFASVLSESRKWKLSLTLAHQYLGQLPLALRQAILGNIGSVLVFRIGADDAGAMAAELGIENASTLTDTQNFSAWAKVMQDGNPSDAIFLDTIYPDSQHAGGAGAVIARTRARHTRPRWLVETNVLKQFRPRETS